MRSIGAIRALQLYSDYGILLHPKSDKLCNEGDNSFGNNNYNSLQFEELQLTPALIGKSSIDDNLDQGRIVHNLSGLLRSKELRKILKKNFEEKKEQELDFESITNKKCVLLTNTKKEDITSIGNYILDRINARGLKLSKVLSDIDDRKKNDDLSCEGYSSNSDDENNDSGDDQNDLELKQNHVVIVETYHKKEFLLKQVNKSIFYFLIKSKFSNVSNEVLAAYHQYYDTSLYLHSIIIITHRI